LGLLTPDRILPNTDGTFCCQAKGLYCVMDFPENSRSRASDYLINDRSGSSVSGCNARLCCTGFFDFIFFVSRYNAEMVGQYQCIDSGDAQCEGFGLF
jgi:hypothetical protein